MTNRKAALSPELAASARLLSAEQTAELLGITVRSLDANISRGFLPADLCIRVGGSKRFRLARLIAWLDEAGGKPKQTGSEGSDNA
jgi:hypothetical protein